MARREEVLKQLANTCQQWTNQPVYYYACDLSNAVEVELLLEKIQSIDVDIVINNAGRGYLKQAVDLSKEEIEEMLQLNLYTLIQITQKYLPKFIQKKSGMVVQNASQAGKTATPKSSVYSASKFGVIGYSNALRLELKEQGIHVMTVNPGRIATQFFETAEPAGKYLASVSVANGVITVTGKGSLNGYSYTMTPKFNANTISWTTSCKGEDVGIFPANFCGATTASSGTN